MIQLTDKEILEFKKICEKDGIKYETEAEYLEAANNLLRFAELAYDMAKDEHLRKLRLKDEPQGYELKGEGRTCFVCHACTSDTIWYDKWGLKCKNCHAAFKKKIYPGYVVSDRNNERHITDTQLSWKFKLRHQTIKKLVRDGKLKPRIIPNGPWIFLKSENPELPAIISGP